VGGGIGLASAQLMATSASLASAASTLTLRDVAVLFTHRTESVDSSLKLFYA